MGEIIELWSDRIEVCVSVVGDERIGEFQHDVHGAVSERSSVEGVCAATVASKALRLVPGAEENVRVGLLRSCEVSVKLGEGTSRKR